MTISIDVPKEIMNRLQVSWGDLSRRALEAVAVEAYRDRVLSSADVGRLLGHASRHDTDSFLHERQAFLEYDEDDLMRDVKAIRDPVGG